jgi:pectate lyase
MTVTTHPTRTPRSRGLRSALAGAAALLVAVTGTVLTAPAANAATVDTSAWYVLVNRQSGKALDVLNWSTADGAQLIQYTRADGANQQFQFVDSGSGYYRLRSKHSGKVLDIWEWSTADGAEVRQFTDLGGDNQQFKLSDSEGGRVRLVSKLSNKVVQVKDRALTDAALIVQGTNTNAYNQQWELVKVAAGTTPPPATQTGLVGWAAQNGGTTGGGSAAATTVTSSSALVSAAAGTTAGVVRVSGTISCSGMLKIGSNKTIVGVGTNAKIVGCGLNISGQKNVIVRNIAFSGWNDDAINIETSTNVWVDHNTFSDGYDGTVDTKRGSDYVTISWNRYFDHDKNMLVGHSDDNGSQDRGHLRVTYHHNWFDGTNQRNPRVRFGNPVHVYNNYYASVGTGGGYGVASTQEAGVLVEGNYFENTADPFHRGEGSSDPGNLVARNNYFTGSGTGDQGGSVASIPYSYTLDTASSVKASVMAGAGAGKL